MALGRIEKRLIGCWGMRKVFGVGTVMEGAGPGEASLRFGSLALRLLPSAGDHQPVPDLSAYVGRALMFSGELPTPNGTLNRAEAHWTSLADGEGMIETMCCATVTGNAGSAPEVAASGGRVSLSIAYANRGRGEAQETSWLKVGATQFLDSFNQLQQVEAGARLIVSGTLESYIYEEANYLRLIVFGVSLNGPAVASSMPSFSAIGTAGSSELPREAAL